MKAIYSDRAKQDPEYPRLVYATSVLADVLNSPTGPALRSPGDDAEVQWDVSENAAEGVRYLVRLKNWMSSTRAELKPDDVTDVHSLRFRMIQLCSNILREYTHQLLGITSPAGV